MSDSGGNAGTVLVVDDSPVDALVLERMLAKAGYEPVTAHDGQTALAMAIERRPALILLDMTMPGMDGAATCLAIRAHPATEKIPVVFVTAHSDSDHVMRAFAAGGSDYVTKPIRFSEVLARISVHLKLRAAEEALLGRNAELLALARRLEETNVQLAHQGKIDGLTGLLNRRAWDQAAAVEEERAHRHEHPYALLMIDVDCFKAFNDALGHPAGDACLQQVADAIRRACRTSDVAGRYGGEEFVVLAPETTGLGAARLAERIRHSVWELAVRHPGSPAGRVTVSIGVAGSEEGLLADALRAADRYLYRAKNAGRNVALGRSSGGTSAVDGERRAAAADGEAPAAPRVLIVEDNMTNRRIYRRCLEKAGCEVIEAEDGQAALAAVARCQPDVILMDYAIPVIDGVECTRRLKTAIETRDTPIVIVSARDDSASILAGLEAGAEEYLTKPVRTDELTARVRSMLRLAVERQDLLRSYRLRAEQIRFLTILVDFCRSIGAASVAEEVLDQTLQAVAEITCCRRVAALMPGPDRQLTVARQCGLDESALAGVQIVQGQGPIGRAFAEHERVLVGPAGEGAAGEGSPAALGEPPLLIAPICAGSQALGVLCVSGRFEPRPFESREAEYVELIAGIAGAALHTVRIRQARDEARDLVVTALARLAEHRDADTGRHVERVTRFASLLAETLRGDPRFASRIDDRFLSQLRRAVPLHDIGKVAIPDDILRKPNRLTLDEMEIMRSHVEIGVQTLRPLVAKVPDAEFLKTALDVVRAHHEWYDGSGYPQRLCGEQIPLSARIVALADVYDALTTDRVYRRALSCEEAERMIGELSGTQFDPAVVEAFMARRAAFRELARQLADPPEPAALSAPPVLSPASAG